jgi:hypothetical protein
MLDDVERRRFLVDPTREDPLPLLIRALDVELEEGAGERLRLPRRALLAGAQADDRILYAHRLTGLEHQVADDSVSLVQKTDHRDPIGHRCDARDRDIIGRLVGRDRLACLVVLARRRLGPSAAGGQQGEGDGNEEKAHAQSGVHGW